MKNARNKWICSFFCIFFAFLSPFFRGVCFHSKICSANLCLPLWICEHFYASDFSCARRTRRMCKWKIYSPNVSASGRTWSEITPIFYHSHAEYSHYANFSVARDSAAPARYLWLCICSGGDLATGSAFCAPRQPVWRTNRIRLFIRTNSLRSFRPPCSYSIRRPY